MDERPPGSTLFLHEDLLAQTLDYEKTLAQWREFEVVEGRGDPGRPEYQEVFGGVTTTRHRFHTPSFDILPLLRVDPDGGEQEYRAKDCPGVNNPSSQHHFPVIDTLLSIPFSLLHNLPRLMGIVPLTTYQHKVILMALEIVRLWYWKPTEYMFLDSERCRLAIDPHVINRSPKPAPISSRTGITFASVALTASEDVFSIATHYEPPDEAGPFKLLVTHPIGSPPVSETWDYQDTESTETLTIGGSGDIEVEVEVTKESHSSIENVEGAWDFRTWKAQRLFLLEDLEIWKSKSTLRRKVIIEIRSWSRNVVDSDPDMPGLSPLVPDSFEQGAIPSMSVNDVLMTRGLISPPVYIKYLDLSTFDARCCPSSGLL